MIDLLSSQVPVIPTSQGVPIRLSVLRSVAELQSIREHWVKWQQHPNCDFEFFRTVVGSLETVVRPQVMVVFRGEAPVGMLIGRLDQSSVDLSIGYKRIISVPALSLTLLHGGWVGETSDEIAQALKNGVLQSLHAGEADFVYFNHPRTDGHLYEAVSKVAQTGATGFIGTLRNHRGMNLYPSSAEFVKHLGTKERNNQKRRARRLQEDYGEKASIVSYRAVSELETLIRDSDQVAKKTYQRALGVGFEDTPDLRERMRTEAEHGWLRGFVLYLDHVPVAFWLGTCYGQTFYSGFTGYDPDFSKYSPGMYLLIKAMEELCEQNSDGALKKADFGLGDAEWKQVLGDLEWQDAPVWIFPTTAKGFLLLSIRRVSGFLDSTGKRLLSKFQLIAKVKRAWRKRLGGS